MDLLGLIAGSMALAWLLPNHYLPWTAAWGEGLALAALCAAALWLGSRCRGAARVSGWLALVAVLGIAMAVGQYLTGHLVYFGDALLVVIYLSAWLLALCVGCWLGSGTRPDVAPTPFIVAWSVAAMAAVAIGLLQWTGSHGQTIYIVDLPPNASPWSNVASRTQFASICFIGLCGLGWLRQTRRVGGLAFALGVSLLMLGMVMSTARTAWLQVAWLVLLLLLIKGRAGSSLSRAAVVTMALTFVGLVAVWPIVADLLLLSSGRTHDEQLSAGFRLRHWSMMIEAIGRAPWFGWGWTQASVAQQAVAVDFPPIGEQIDSSHNLVLDLMLWNGIPVALAVVIALLVWFIGRVFRCRDRGNVWLLAAIGGLLGHSMVEYPLQYAYFLVPAGLLMGIVDARAGVARAVVVPRVAVLVAAGTLAMLLLLVGRDYLRAEESHRMLRLESARIGVDRIVTPPQQLHVLTQLEAYLRVVRTAPTPAMDRQAIDQIQIVADRFGDSTVMFIAALAAGLNDRPKQAADQLTRICRIHQARVCDDVLRRWQAISAQQYPQLQSIAVPPRPKPCRTPGAVTDGCS